MKISGLECVASCYDNSIAAVAFCYHGPHWLYGTVAFHTLMEVFWDGLAGCPPADRVHWPFSLGVETTWSSVANRDRQQCGSFLAHGKGDQNRREIPKTQLQMITERGKKEDSRYL